MKRFKNILVVSDEQSAFEAAFERAVWLAQANDARLTLIDVIDAAPGELSRRFSTLSGGRGQQIEAQVVDTHRARLQKQADALAALGIPATTKVHLGTPFIEVIRSVLKNGHDLVIKGAERSPDRRFFRGPDMHLMRKCPCPVWLLNSSVEPQARHILAAVDPDPDNLVRHRLNLTIMELSAALAEHDAARLDILNVWHLPEEATLRQGVASIPTTEIDHLVAEEERQSKWRLQMLMAQFPCKAETRRVLHLKGVAADVISEHVTAEGVDTVVMGTVARSGVSGLLIGNTAETIISRLKCSVLTVKPPGFVSPVTMTLDENGAY